MKESEIMFDTGIMGRDLFGLSYLDVNFFNGLRVFYINFYNMIIIY